MRRLRLPLAAAVVAVSLAGCAQGVSGTAIGTPPPLTSAAPVTSAAPTTSSSTSTTPTPTPTSTTATPTPTPTPTPVRLFSSAQLPGLLVTAPSGSQSWNNAWGRQTRPSLGQFVANKYRATSRAQLVALLRAQGLTTIAHRTWIARDSQQADFVLLRFDSVEGARSRFLNQTQAQAASTNSPVVRLPGLPGVQGYRFAGLTSLGNVETIFYALVRNVDVELYYYCPSKYRQADAVTWMRAQLTKLR